ncbi:methyltransferase-like protein 24 [Aplysia californica]|uniref:Methyltransferase-like protein 24 n=1 Tax=Aplysia californica TaxID=6500 RepID=A0ABM0JXH0_APLCA|nr:methyltransferase-like protein 24 [Aplysia californica]XP_012941043.1 methyltransferase-like protein 24 [Aplysia californica]
MVPGNMILRRLKFIKKRTLAAYILSLSSAGFFLWVFVFVSSSNSAPGESDGHLVSGDRRGVDQSVNPVPKPLLADGQRSQGLSSDAAKAVLADGLKPVLIPNNTVLHAMTHAELSALYHRYLSVIQVKCEEIHRVGKVTDGGWDVCGDKPHVPKPPCVVYSFGVGDDFSFDDAVVKNYGCKVYSFDPSMKMGNKRRGENSFFYQQGLADSDRTLPNGWVMSRFDTIRASLKHIKSTIHIVKMDIEEWEWEVLPDLLTSDSLRNVGQLLIELHQCDGCSKYNPDQHDKEPPRERYVHMLELLSLLYQQHYRIFHRHDNSACRYMDKFTQTDRNACLEIGFVRVS